MVFLSDKGSHIICFLLLLSFTHVGFYRTGSAIGNLYYFSWAMFLVAITIASECYGAFLNPPASMSDEDNGNKQNGGEIEVETFDDAI